MLSQSSQVMGLGLVVLVSGFVIVPACDSGGSGGSTTVTMTTAGKNSMGGDAGGTNGGSTNGGTAGTAGATAGSGGNMTFGCSGVVPPSAAITDFTDLMPAAEPLWGATPAAGAFYGGLISYGAAGAIPVTDVTGNDLRVTGTIKDYSGAGLYMAFCTDASRFAGVRFKISGDAGPAKSVLFYVLTNSNFYPDSVAMKGVCQASAANKFIDCVSPSYSVTGIGAEKLVEVTWDKLNNGKPVSAATTDGKDIIGLQWSFPWTAATMPYDVDLVIDDVEFIDTAAGGAGGAGSGGAGNAPGGAGAGGA